MKVSDIKKHFEITNLALDVKNYEVVNIQTRYFLNSGKSDLIEIAELLNSKNYRQAQYLMKKITEESDDIIEFPQEQSTEKILNIEDMLKMSPIAKETIREFKQSSYTKEDLEGFAKNIQIPTKVEDEEEKSSENNFEVDNKESKQNDNTNTENSVTSKKSEDQYKDIDDSTPLDEISKEVLSKTSTNENVKKPSTYKTLKEKFGKKNIKEEKNSLKEKSIKPEVEKSESTVQETILYPPISHLSQKYRELFTLYPPVKESDVWLEDIALLINRLSTNSYSDNDIEDIYKKYERHLNEGELDKASQYLLLLSITESKYPKFILARELFKGKVLKREIKKSYDLMEKLASDGYGNAICDLGQFYEYGIIVPENKNKALKLYEKSFELGIDRAINHINRIKENSGMLKKLFK